MGTGTFFSLLFNAVKKSGGDGQRQDKSNR